MVSAWSKEETLKLIEAWGNGAIQALLDGCKHNQEVFDKIVRELRDASYERTGKQCRNKVKQLKGDYRKIIDKRNTTGEGRYPEWEFYDATDAILGHKPATQPPVVGQSLEDEDQASASLQQLPEATPQSSSHDIFERTQATPSTSTSRPETPTPAVQKDRRKRSRMEKDSALELIHKLVKVQEDSDRRMMELEERRLKFEQEQLEREHQPRLEERQFRLQMMQMIIMCRPNFNFTPSPTPRTEEQSSVSHRMHTFQFEDDNNYMK